MKLARQALELKNKLIFVHIPKTGGESIAETLTGPSLIRKRVLKAINPRLSKVVIPGITKKTCKHDSLSTILEKTEVTELKLCVFFVVRNPYDRMYSFYKHLRRWEWDPRYSGVLPNPQIAGALAKLYEFNEWLQLVLDKDFPSIEKDRSRCPVDHFKPINNFVAGVPLNSIVYPLRFENLEQDWEELATVVGLPRNLKHNNSSYGGGARANDVYDDAGVKAINEKFASDFSEYRYPIFNSAESLRASDEN